MSLWTDFLITHGWVSIIFYLVGVTAGALFARKYDKKQLTYVEGELKSMTTRLHAVVKDMRIRDERNDRG